MVPLPSLSSLSCQCGRPVVVVFDVRGWGWSGGGHSAIAIIIIVVLVGAELMTGGTSVTV